MDARTHLQRINPVFLLQLLPQCVILAGELFREVPPVLGGLGGWGKGNTNRAPNTRIASTKDSKTVKFPHTRMHS